MGKKIMPNLGVNINDVSVSDVMPALGATESEPTTGMTEVEGNDLVETPIGGGLGPSPDRDEIPSATPPPSHDESRDTPTSPGPPATHTETAGAGASPESGGLAEQRVVVMSNNLGPRLYRMDEITADPEIVALLNDGTGRVRLYVEGE